MTAFNFSNMLCVWKTPCYVHGSVIENDAKTLLMNGGEACIREKTPIGTYNYYYGGEGAGVRTPYTYKGVRADSVDIITKLIYNCFSGGLISSAVGEDSDGNPLAYICDNKVSPYEGLDGMMLEFNTTDVGLRSSARYCEVSFLMLISLVLFSRVTYRWEDHKHTALYRKMWNGINDFLYKIYAGYRSYANLVSNIDIATNISGLKFAEAIFEEFFVSPEQLTSNI